MATQMSILLNLRNDFISLVYRSLFYVKISIEVSGRNIFGLVLTVAP